MYNVDSVVIVINLAHGSEVNGAQENGHVHTLDTPETPVDRSLVLEALDKSLHGTLADKSVAIGKESHLKEHRVHHHRLAA